MERTPLKEIQPNWRCGTELSPYAHGIIKGMRQKGVKFQEIGDTLQILKLTIQYTVKKQPLRQEGKSLACPG
jgi:hypothetical protein